MTIPLTLDAILVGLVTGWCVMLAAGLLVAAGRFAVLVWRDRCGRKG